MNNLKSFCVALMLAGLLGFSSSTSQAAGLSTAFADVVVEDVPIGKPFFVNGPSGRGLVVQNLGDAPVRVKFQALVPAQSQLRGGAQSIPDAGWLSFDPPEITIPSRGEGVCRISLHIPPIATHKAKFFQVMIWSQGQPDSAHGLKMAAGLLSRLRFHSSAN